uniref:NADH dehydrogenase subunit 6 n=1 Tax=Tetraloides heterodactylus TaxID=3022721 RepID=UPI0028D4EA44|nr:NADH dehydrogenase subunit 6 [Tetraloides heterodactylus]WMQ53217.1 NADH dehydrogenase subunit 6 [Tetraloides heterodactylus]
MTLMMIPSIFMISFLFTRLTHPLSLGLSLLIQTILISMTAGLYTSSFWFSYILFMIFLGGMLVLFIYVASLASNEFFNFSLMTFFSFFFLLLSLIFFAYFLDPMLTSSKSSIFLSPINTNLMSTPSIISWIYSQPLMNFTLFIILYLLLTLLVVVKITNLFTGPLRLSN